MASKKPEPDAARFTERELGIIDTKRRLYLPHPPSVDRAAFLELLNTDPDQAARFDWIPIPKVV